MTRIEILTLTLALAVCGCGDDESTATPDEPQHATHTATTTEATPATPPRPEGATADAPSAEAGATQGDGGSNAQGGPTTARPGPDPAGAPTATPLDAIGTGDVPGACERADQAPLEVMPERGAPGLTAEGDALWVAGYRHEEGREWVQVMQVAADRTRTAAELPVEPPLTQTRHAAPAVLHDNGHVIVAYTDGRGRLLVATPGQAPTLVTELSDIRLSPTLANVAGGYAVTFTDSNGPTPRAILVRLSPDLARLAEHVLHPAYMGGTAPFLVREPDGSAHRVAFADPRRGLSTLMLVELGADGAPRGEPSTVSVVSQLSDPARVVMVEARNARRLHIGFTAVDARGATAVGHLYSDGPGNPRPLIANRGYGILDLDALGLPNGALFVADSPLADPDTSPRELVIRQVSPGGFGEPLAIRSPDGTARAGRLARLADGTLMVAYTGLSALYVERLRCPEVLAASAAEPSAAAPPP